jgi:hypothetical protein
MFPIHITTLSVINWEFPLKLAKSPRFSYSEYKPHFLAGAAQRQSSTIFSQSKRGKNRGDPTAAAPIVRLKLPNFNTISGECCRGWGAKKK